MNNFEEERKIEKEFYALIEYFKTILKLQKSRFFSKEARLGLYLTFLEADYEKFYLMDGMTNLNRLAIAVASGNLDLNNYKFNELYEKLLVLRNIFNNTEYGKSTYLIEALTQSEMIISRITELREMVNKYPIQTNSFELLYSMIPNKIKEENVELIEEIRFGEKESAKVKKKG